MLPTSEVMDALLACSSLCVGLLRTFRVLDPAKHENSPF